MIKYQKLGKMIKATVNGDELGLICWSNSKKAAFFMPESPESVDAPYLYTSVLNELTLYMTNLTKKDFKFIRNE